MTLDNFLVITRLVANDMTIGVMHRPDAVCVSRAIFDELSRELEKDREIPYASMYNRRDGRSNERINNLALFVDDDMPDEYYEVGYMKIFIDRMKARIKRLE